MSTKINICRTRSIFTSNLSWFHSSSACIEYFRGFCGVHYYILLIVIFVAVIDAIVSMKLVKLKEFVVFRPCRRVEAGYNDMVNEIYEVFPPW